MRLIKSIENNGLRIARSDLEEGTPDDIVIRAEKYLELLEQHLGALRGMKGVPQVSLAGGSKFARLLIEQMRSEIRSEIEESIGEKNRIQSLIDSLLLVSGWSAILTLNEQLYRNACDWELIGTSVRSISAGASMAIPDAAIEASRLRRESYFATRRAA